MSGLTVAVLGASDNPARFSNKAVKRLAEAGHRVIPVNPGLDSVEGIRTSPDLDSIETQVDTLTIYVSPERVIPFIPSILKMRPGRVVMNPGAESELLAEALDNAKIPCVKACTLIMLSKGEF